MSSCLARLYEISILGKCERSVYEFENKSEERQNKNKRKTK